MTVFCSASLCCKELLFSTVLCILLHDAVSFQSNAAMLRIPNAATSPGAGLQPLKKLRTARNSCSSLAMGPLDGWVAAAKYRETCPPQSCVEQLLLDQIRKQDFDPTLLHWAHPATMLLLVAPAMGYAAYLGWRIRLDTETKENVRDQSSAFAQTEEASSTPELASGEESATSAVAVEEQTPQIAAPAVSGMSGQERQSAGSTHAVLMSVAALFSVFGIQGGLGSMLLAGKPILESPHAATGFIFTGLLGLQGGIASQMGGNKLLRSAHAYLGSALVAVLVLHAGLGLGLGFSFSHPTGYEETAEQVAMIASGGAQIALK